jgi:hypothetical protein
MAFSDWRTIVQYFGKVGWDGRRRLTATPRRGTGKLGRVFDGDNIDRPTFIDQSGIVASAIGRIAD